MEGINETSISKIIFWKIKSHYCERRGISLGIERAFLLLCASDDSPALFFRWKLFHSRHWKASWLLIGLTTRRVFSPSQSEILIRQFFSTLTIFDYISCREFLLIFLTRNAGIRKQTRRKGQEKINIYREIIFYYRKVIFINVNIPSWQVTFEILRLKYILEYET